MKKKLKIDESSVLKEIEELEINKNLKLIFLSLLNKVLNNTISTIDRNNLLNSLLQFEEEYNIYDLTSDSQILISTIHLFIREILKDPISRQTFYKNTYDKLEKMVKNRDLIGFLDIFIYETNSKELKEIFKEDLNNFYEYIYNIVISEVSKYFETNVFWLFFDYEICEKFDETFSNFILNKIKETVYDNNIENFCKIYTNFFKCLNKEDLIYLFSYDGLNLIQFLSGIDDIYNYKCFDHGFGWYLLEKCQDPELSKVISKAVLEYIFNHEKITYEDAIYQLGFFKELTKDQINSLIKDPNVSFFNILLEYKMFLAGERGDIAEFGKFLKKMDISIKDDIIDLTKNGSLDDISVIWKYWLWDDLSLEEIKELLEARDLNFLEKILKNAFHYFRDYNLFFSYYIPDRIRKHLRIPMKNSIIKIIKKAEMDSFVPLIALRLLDYFDTIELLSLIDDDELKLVQMIKKAIDKHGRKISELNEMFYEWEINFYKLLAIFNYFLSHESKLTNSDDYEFLYNRFRAILSEIPMDKSVLNLRGYDVNEEFVTINNRKIYVKDGVLDLSGLNLYKLDIVKGLFQLKRVKSLNLSGNYLNNLSIAIGNLTSLESLNVSNNNLSQLPDSLGKLKYLRNLNISSTNLKKLPNSLGELKFLVHLNFSWNQIKIIPNSFKNYTNLKELNARKNLIEIIPAWIGKLRNLEVLNFAQNIAIERIPKSITKLKSLEYFSISHCWKINEVNFIGELLSLKKLYLNGTRIYSLPRSIGNLKSLEQIYLGSDSYNLIIPDSILNCTSLNYISLGREIRDKNKKIIEKLKEKGVRVH